MKKQVTISVISVSVLNAETGALTVETFKAYGKVGTAKAVKLANEKFNQMIVVPTVKVTTDSISVDIVLPELV